MKVMFINDSNITPKAIIPKIGEIVTVIGFSFIYDGNYIIFEYPEDKNGCRQSFKPYRFIPISDIDETELTKEREKEFA